MPKSRSTTHDRAVELDVVAEHASTCTNCDLFAHATQTVFGAGHVDAPLMLVGEQPGDKEDVAGLPFVGPAGRLLNRAMEEAQITAEQVYLTNVVKHFKWRRSGTVRLHKKPNAEEITACRPWFEHELELVRPHLVVLMGATAAQSVLGSSFRVTRDRGRLVDWPYEPDAMATLHPSAVLRAEDRREEMFRMLVDDLTAARRHVQRA